MKKAMSMYKLGTLRVKLNKLKTKRLWGNQGQKPNEDWAKLNLEA